MRHNRFDSLINILTKSLLFSEDFPKRNRFSHAKFASLSDDERVRAHEPGLIAISRVQNAWKLADAVTELGEAKYDVAVPLLTKLWTDCSLQPVRNAAGHSLRAIGNREARQSLLDHIEDSDHLSVHLAVASVFDEDPLTAFNRLAHYFEPERVVQRGGAVIPNAILWTFAPSSFTAGDHGEMYPHWMESSAASWLRMDHRWIELCIALRHDKHLGHTARTVLRYADPDLTGPALKKARIREGPHIVRVKTQTTGDLLDRYLRGEYVVVWNELRTYEALGGVLLDEARAVAKETMMRVSRNANRLGERLHALGWQPLYSELRTKPQANDQDVMQKIEQISGAQLPVSLRAFWEIVGGINFVWDYNRGEAPDLGVNLAMVEMDPLCVAAPKDVTHLFEEWADQRDGVNPEFADPLSLDLAPDHLHKANISGGVPYGIELPFHGADPIFSNEDHELPFVDYLRLCFRWAGFPRLERYAARPDVHHFLEVMSKDFEAF